MAGAVYALAIFIGGVTPLDQGLCGSTPTGAGLLLHLVLSAIAGMAYCMLVQNKPSSISWAISCAALFALILWLIGLMTVPYALNL